MRLLSKTACSVVDRQTYSSSDSSDSGYPRTALSADPMCSALISPGHDSGSSVTTHASRSNRPIGHVNAAFDHPASQSTSGGEQQAVRHGSACNHLTQLVKSMPEHNSLLHSYIHAWKCLPKDIIEDDNIFLDQNEEKIYEMISPSVSPSGVKANLTELAEKVTDDVAIFLKDKLEAECNESRGMTAIDCDVMEHSNQHHGSFLNGGAEVSKCSPAVASDLGGELIGFRSGVELSQLHYSRELIMLYDMVSPQLLVSGSCHISKLVHQYREQAKEPVVSQVRIQCQSLRGLMQLLGCSRFCKSEAMFQLLQTFETCWLMEPVCSAAAVHQDLRQALQSVSSLV